MVGLRDITSAARTIQCGTGLERNTMQININNSPAASLLKVELRNRAAEFGVSTSALTTILLSYALSHMEEAAKEYFKPRSPVKETQPPNAFERSKARGLRTAEVDVQPKSEAVAAMFASLQAKGQ